MNNFISLYGEVLDYPQQASIDKKGTEYYKFNLAVQRESGIIDILPIVVEEDTAAYNALADMENVLRDTDTMAEDVIRSSGRVGLDIIPANMNMDAAAVDLMLDQEANQIVRLKDVLDQVEEQYDYCLIDCPPGVGINVLNALAAADDVIIPIKADKNALDGMEELTEVIEEIRPYNPGLSLVKCLVTMFTNDISVVKGEEALRKSEYSTFNTHIRYSKKVVDWTYEKRKSLIETTPRSAATRDYKSLAAEYIRLTRKEG